MLGILETLYPLLQVLFTLIPLQKLFNISSQLYIRSNVLVYALKTLKQMY